MLTITPLKHEHIEESAQLVSVCYQQLRLGLPHLPARYEQPDVIQPLLNDLLARSGEGVAAFREGRLVGFLTAWKMSSFRGKRSIFSPEWANAADPEDGQRIYEEMYSQLAASWVAEKYSAHYISLFPNNARVLQAWHWLGFGMISIDAVRNLDPIPGGDSTVSIRRAGLEDIEQVMVLSDALWEYEKGTPIFLLTDHRQVDLIKTWLQDPHWFVWLAEREGLPLAFLCLGPANDGVSTIIYDEKTTSIYAAFTKEEARRFGVATTLLNHALLAARQAGYQRCAVDFEPMNLLGTRFWLRYFKPACFSLLRNIDERVM